MFSITQYRDGEPIITRQIEVEDKLFIHQGDNIVFDAKSSAVTELVQEGLDLILSFADGKHLLLEHFFYADKPHVESTLTFSDALFTLGEIETCFDVKDTASLQLIDIVNSAVDTGEHTLTTSGRMTGSVNIAAREDAPFLYYFTLAKGFSKQTDVTASVGDDPLPEWLTFQKITADKYVLTGVPADKNIGPLEVTFTIHQEGVAKDINYALSLQVLSRAAGEGSAYIAEVEYMTADSGFTSSVRSFQGGQPVQIVGSEVATFSLPAIAVASATSKYRSVIFAATVMQPFLEIKEITTPQIQLEPPKDVTPPSVQLDIIPETTTTRFEEAPRRVVEKEEIYFSQVSSAEEDAEVVAAVEEGVAIDPTILAESIDPLPTPVITEEDDGVDIQDPNVETQIEDIVPLFTDLSDTVDFNDANGDGVAGDPIIVGNFSPGTIYNAGAGGDFVTLPLSSTLGVSGYDPTQTFFGEAGNDVITGRDLSDSIDGGSGADTLDGGLGADFLNGGADDDILIYDSLDTGADSINGGSGSDTLLFNTSGNTFSSASFPLGAPFINIESIDLGNLGNTLVFESDEPAHILNVDGDAITVEGPLVIEGGATDSVTLTLVDWTEIPPLPGFRVIVGGTGAESVTLHMENAVPLNFV